MKIPLGRMMVDEVMRQAVLRVLRDGMTTEGQETQKFEEDFARYIGARYCIATSSGTGALFTIFHALSKRFLHVVTSPLTYMATYNAPSLLGYPVEFVDVDANTFGIDMNKVSPSKGDILLPVHLLGYPVDDIRRHDGIIIEDACEAVGSTYGGGIRVGSLGYASAYSFYPSHTIQVGEMGAITTNDEEFANKCRLIKDNGRDRHDRVNGFLHKYTGFNFKTSDVMAAIANVQLERIDSIVKRRQEIAKFYSDEIGNIPNLSVGKFDDRCAYLGYPIICKDEDSVRNLSQHLTRIGVETRFMFPLIYNQPVIKGYSKESCPIAERISLCGMYIPCHQHLTNDEVYYVVSAIKEATK